MVGELIMRVVYILPVGFVTIAVHANDVMSARRAMYVVHLHFVQSRHLR